MKRLLSFLTFGCIVLLLLVVSKCKNDAPVQPPPVVQDTTSHDFVFYKDTLGDYYSHLNDVFIINENDVWTVGEIHTKDTDKHDSLGNMIPPYNAAHWDGNRWTLKRIAIKVGYGSGQIIRYESTPLQTVYSNAANDVWFISGIGGVTRFKDGTWNEMVPPYKQGPGPVNKIFGLSPEDIYFVGRVGIITHWNGNSFINIPTNTTTDFQDIWGGYNPGTYQFEILAVASNPLKDQNKLLVRLNNNTLSAISDSGCRSMSRGIWFEPGIKYYIAGDGIFEKYCSACPDYWKEVGFFPTYFEGVRGNAANDVVCVGDYGGVVHFNGKTWKSFDQQTRLANGKYQSVSMKGNVFFAAGENSSRGIVLRAYRK